MAPRNKIAIADRLPESPSTPSVQLVALIETHMSNVAPTINENGEMVITGAQEPKVLARILDAAMVNNSGG